MNQKIFKLKGIYKDKIWGYEDWNLCCNDEGQCIIDEGSLKGESLWKVLDYKPFPVLLKIINAKRDLSIQVHPTKEYCKKVEHVREKNECWYVLNAEKDACIYCGLNKEITKEELDSIIGTDKIEKYLNKIVVEKGNFVYMPAGVIHAIGAGVEVLEVQQNSNITYRIYDYNRGRTLHIDKAKDVIDIEQNLKIKKENDLRIFTCEDFSVEKICVNESKQWFTENSSEAIFILSGEGIIKENNDLSSAQRVGEGETFYIRENTAYTLQGDLKIIKTSFVY